MIEGKRRVLLTPKTILEKITEYDIFRYYMPHKDWKLNVTTFSPFLRSGGIEDNPSFMIGNRKGTLSFIDFADTSKRGDCFEFVKQMYCMMSMDDVLRKIDNDFQLGITSGFTGDYKKITSEYTQPEELGKRYSLVQAITRPFLKEELEYWNQYHQSLQDLRDNHIYSIKHLYLNKNRFPLKDTDLRFGYLYEGHWKIYRPFVVKKYKWVPNNVPITMLDGKDDIRNGCDALFIQKSKKDYMVMKKVYPCNIAVQNEGIACFSHENLEFIREHSKHQILSFDSDPAGVQNSQMITKLLGFDYCNVPRKYLSEGIKDWADLAKAHGLQAIENYLNQKGLL